MMDPLLQTPSSLAATTPGQEVGVGLQLKVKGAAVGPDSHPMDLFIALAILIGVAVTHCLMPKNRCPILFLRVVC